MNFNITSKDILRIWYNTTTQVNFQDAVSSQYQTSDTWLLNLKTPPGESGNLHT